MKHLLLSLQVMLSPFHEATGSAIGWGQGTACSLCHFFLALSCCSFLCTCFLCSSMRPPQAASPSGVPSGSTMDLFSGLALPYSWSLSPFLKCIFTGAPHIWLMGSAGSCGGLAVGPAGTICARKMQCP